MVSLQEDSLVYLKCVKEASKLRTKIISPGFFNEANCQFPRNIRVEGMKYTVPLHAISFSESSNHKFFYRIDKNYIKIYNAESDITQIFEDDTTTECTICMNANKEIVFAKCGHYICCEECSLTIFQTTKKCPVCRTKIDEIVKRDLIEI